MRGKGRHVVFGLEKVPTWGRMEAMPGKRLPTSLVANKNKNVDQMQFIIDIVGESLT
jgi:hypothetical protein